MMSFSEFLIEVGRQQYIAECGTTKVNESKLHLRKFSNSSFKSYMSRSVTELERLGSRLERERKDDKKFDLLSKQFQEIAKMMMLLASRELD